MKFTIAAQDAGQRLDVWLAKKVGSRNQAKKLLDAGRVILNGKKVYIAGWQLKAKDFVEVQTATTKEKKSTYVKIIFEDRDIIVVDKPHGVLSVAGDSNKPDMAKLVMDYLRRKYAKSAGSFLYPLHRLDEETSGVMVFARSKAAVKLEDAFRRHTIARRYIAIVCGRLPQSEGVIDAPLEKGDFGEGQKSRVAKGKHGVTAITEYNVKELYKNATLIEVNVRTGRTHQIRVHMAHIGHPLIGDKLYGSTISFPRHALHAHMLGFAHPATGKRMRFHSNLPKDLMVLIDELRGNVE